MNIFAKLSALLIGLLTLFHTSPAPQPAFGGNTTPQPYAFAKVDAQGNVLTVIMATQAFIDTGAEGNSSDWVPTYDNGTKKNFASTGYTYDKTLDAFIAPKPRADFNFDTTTAQWIEPAKAILASTSTPL